MIQVLGGVVGSTQTVFGLFEGARPEELTLSRRQQFDNANFSGLVGMIGEFMHGVRVDAAAFGVAEPVRSGESPGRNLPWSIREAELKPVLGTEHCVLLNDVAAAAHGIRASDPAQHVWLQRAPLDPHAPVALVSVGKGYNRALVLPPADLRSRAQASLARPRARFDGRASTVLASEAGYAGFAPRNAIERRLLNYLTERLEQVSLEDLLSAASLRRLHDFLVFEGLAPAHALAEIERAPDPNAEIARLGGRDLDRACAAAVAFFADLLGAELSNVALNYLPFGGLYLTGSLARRLRSVFEEGELLHAFLERESPVKELLSAIPLILIDDPDLTLLGTRCAAERLLASD